MQRIFPFLFIVICSIACVPQKEVVYFQDDIEDKYIDTEYNIHKSRQIIQPFDEVYIEVISTDREGSNFLQQRERGGFYNTTTPEGLSIISYRVDEYGNVNLPVIGKVKISGLSIEEAGDYMEKQLEDYLYQPSVKINFVNKSITLIGYVSRPGRYYYSSDHINILQALGMAGDIQEFGNRKQVVIIREHENNTTKAVVDLTTEKIFDSPYYNLRSNDVVYVEPLRRRRWGIDTFPYALLLSSITTFILVMEYVK
ncbi:polysaccharide biosynthesis/export family protein [Carboxylicivirga sp. A043]|uniref:polysaccharide biosynthesis/export family protein n=1 Tax=Carboxylicivirga litoralis TaxID=2816963 RepID=UPI0021CB15CD|nr:polysaccharide biosynthesis/export family protein [Carboxylicivirga sp. A043]MCU4157959.1 polysaccharide biosynthesis/export family protein [Carboxylicivirga sp. A043]